MPDRMAYQYVPTQTLEEQQRADAASAWAARQRAQIAQSWADMHVQDAQATLGPLVGQGSPVEQYPGDQGSAPLPEQATSPLSAPPVPPPGVPPPGPPAAPDIGVTTEGDRPPSEFEQPSAFGLGADLERGLAKGYTPQPDAAIEEPTDDQGMTPNRPPFGMEGLLAAGPFGARTPVLPPAISPNVAPPGRREQERVQRGEAPATGEDIVGRGAGTLARITSGEEPLDFSSPGAAAQSILKVVQAAADTGMLGGFLGRQGQSEPGMVAEAVRGGLADEAEATVRQQEARGGYGGDVLGRGVSEIVPPGYAKYQPGGVAIPDDELLKKAVENTPGAQVTRDGLRIEVERFQKPEQAGTVSGRGAVFYTAGGGNDYAGGAGAPFGGPQPIKGPTLLRRPLVVIGSTGTGDVPLGAIDALNPGNRYLSSDLQDAAKNVARGIPSGRTGEADVARVLEQYGGDSSQAGAIVRGALSGETPYERLESRIGTAITENVAAQQARRAGYDSIVGYDGRGNNLNLTEVVDLRESHYPTPEGGFTVHPEFEPRFAGGAVDDPGTARPLEAEGAAGGEVARPLGRPRPGEIEAAVRAIRGATSLDALERLGGWNQRWALTRQDAERVAAAYAERFAVLERGPRGAPAEAAAARGVDLPPVEPPPAAPVPARAAAPEPPPLEPAAAPPTGAGPPREPPGRPPTPPGEPAASGEVARLRLDKEPEAVRGVIQQAAERGDFWRRQRRNVISDDEAQRMADELDRTVGEWVGGGRAGRAYNEEETIALRNAVVGQAIKVDDLKATVEALGDKASDALRRELGEAQSTLLALSRIKEGARAEAGRTFRAYLMDTRGRLARSREPQYTSVSTVPTASAESLRAPGSATPAVTEQAPLITEPVARSGRATNLLGETRTEGSGPTAYDRASLARMAGMLSAAPTHLLNAAGNVVMGATTLALKEGQVGADLLRVGVGRALGKDVQRQRFQAEVGPQIAGYTRGLWAGAKQVPGIMAHGLSDQQIGQIAGARRLESGSAVVDTAVEAPLRALAASDAVFRSASFGGHAAALATRQATQEGLSGARRAARVQEILGNLSDFPGLLESANKLAARDVFQEARLETDAITRLRGMHPGARVAGDLALPFYKTPYNVAAQGAGMTPAGYGAALAAARRGETGEAVDRAVRATAGTAGLALGLNLAGAGMLTGAYPQDPSDRSTLPEGWKPWALRVPSGDGAVYVPLQALGAWALPLAVAASVTDAQKAGRTQGDPSKVVLGAVGSVGKFMLDMSAFQGINTLFNIVQEPERYAERAAEGITSSFVPAGGLLRTVQQAAGEPARDPSNALEAMLAQVPGLASLVPTAQTSLGQDRSRGVSGPLGLVVGSRVTAEAPSSVLAALREANVGIPEPPKAVSHENVRDIPLTESDRRAYRTRAGQELSRRVETAIANPKWAQGSPADRAKFLEDAVRDAREAAKVQTLQAIGKDEIKRRLAAKPAA